MNIVAVGDPPMTEAFQLIGIDGYVPQPGQDVGQLLEQLVRKQGIQLAFVESSLASQLTDDVLERLTRQLGCLVQEVPSVGGAATDPTSFTRAIRSAIGAAM